MRSIRLLTPVLVLLTGSAFAQDFWVKKPYTEWSQRETQKVLRDSPWASRWVMRRAAVVPIGRDTALETAERGSEAAPEVTYTVQIRSALPVRQALVRSSQLEHGDDLPADQLARMRQSHENLLQLQFPETVVLYVEYRTNIPAYDRELAYYWQGQTTETLLDKVHLITPEGRVPVQAYSHTPGGVRGFQFTFPRLHNGKPLIPENARDFSLEFRSPELGSTAPPGGSLPETLANPDPTVPARASTPRPVTQRGEREQRVLVKFSTRKMVLGGKLVY